MGSMEHERILAQGVAVWNLWREDFANIRPDLVGSRAYGADLSGADFRGADLSGADLSGANLTMAELTGARLTGVELAGANLTAAVVSRETLVQSLCLHPFEAQLEIEDVASGAN